jgi:hypothetical protein
MPQHEIIWRDPTEHPDARVTQQSLVDQTTEQARAYAAETGENLGLEVLAVLPLPTEQQERDAVFALHAQLHFALLERSGATVGDLGEEARRAREDRPTIQQAVWDDVTYSDERLGTAFLVGDKYLDLIASTHEEG